MRWAREAWTDGYFWYSLGLQDAIDTPNGNGMLAGAAARFLAEHGDVLSEADATFLRGRVGGYIARLAAQRDPSLRWSYSARQADGEATWRTTSTSCGVPNGRGMRGSTSPGRARRRSTRWMATAASIRTTFC